MPEQKIIVDIKQCPWCHGEKTVSRTGVAQSRSSQKYVGVFTSLKKEVTPIEQPMLASITVEAICVHWDVCADCGAQYCTRAELIDVPVQAQGMPGPGKNPRNLPPFFRGQG